VAFGKRTVTGIDLGGWTVKAVVVEAGKGGGVGARLVACDSEPVARDAGAAGAGAAPSPAAQAAALEALLHRSGLRPRHLGRVAIAVGGDGLTVRQVSLPNLSDAELVASMPFETRRHVPLPKETEIAFSYQVLSRDAEKGTVEVLLGACPKALVRDAVGALERIGVSPEIVDAAPIAGLNAILHAEAASPAGKEAGFLDIGGAASTLTLYRTGGMLLSRRIPIGGEAMTREIAERRKMDAAEAEGLKRGGPLAHDEGLVRLVERSVAELAAELRNSIAFFDARTGRRGLSRLSVGGGGSRIDGLAAALERALGVPVAAVSALPPFARAEALPPALAPRMREQSPELAVAFGLTRWWDA
jgi:type IV pilus assembly protein PilM